MVKSDVFGIKMKCENCLYGCCNIENRKIKNVFCGKFQNDISVTYYKKLRVCQFFEKKKSRCFVVENNKKISF